MSLNLQVDTTPEWVDEDVLESRVPQKTSQKATEVFYERVKCKGMKLMKELGITAVYIPGGCTGYVQPMDTIINKLVKDKIGDILEETLVDDPKEDPDSTSVGDRRIAITHAVVAA